MPTFSPSEKNKMPKISAIIPAFNEEANIEAALLSVQFADEIIVVDSFSTDKTLEIAKKYNAKILQREYENSASQKNWAIPQAAHEWIVLLDADEVLPKELQTEIISTLNKEPKEVAFWMYRTNQFMGRQLKYSGWQRDRVIRLFRKSKCKYEDKKVHAEVLADGPVGRLTHKIEHNTYKGFDHYVEKLNRYAWWQARDYEPKMGRITLFHILIKPWFRFFKHYVVEKGFLDGFPGFMISVLQGYAVLTRYTKIWLIRKGVGF